MHIGPIFPSDGVPDLVPELEPPLIHGPAALAHLAFAGHTAEDLLAAIGRPAVAVADVAALTLDAALVYQLGFDPVMAATLQAQALAQARLFRVAGSFAVRSARPLRVLALMAPGNLMVNTPLDFITAHLDVRLDLLFVVPGQALPAAVPDHDVAFFAVSESEPATLARLRPLFAAWPRPVLNDPAAVRRLARDTVAAGLASLPGVCSPPAMRLSRAALLREAEAPAALPALGWPLLLRPASSHAGEGLQKIDSPAGVAAYGQEVVSDSYFATRFVDYRGADGLYRKLRVAMVDGRPLLCHMASSKHWMVHYLNAGMVESASRRAEEAAAMASFDAGFAVRHRQALAAVQAWMALDYFQLDCAELPDGRLLVFEADVAAIVHLMDPPDLFPYKPKAMRRVFEAFDAMLRRQAAGPRP